MYKKLITQILIVLSMVFFIVGSAEAQIKLDIGPKFGLNVATFTGSDVKDTSLFLDADPGNVVGAVVGISITANVVRYMSIQAEFLYSMKGAAWEASKTDSNTVWEADQWVRLNYFEVPILLRVNVPMQSRFEPYFLAGPALGFYSSGEAKWTGEVYYNGKKVKHDEQYENKIYNTKSTIVSAVFGAGAKLKKGRGCFYFEVRYSTSLGDTFEDTPPHSEIPDIKDYAIFADPYTGEKAKIKHSLFTFQIGYTLSIGL